MVDWIEDGVNPEEWFLLEEFVFNDIDPPVEPDSDQQKKPEESGKGCCLFIAVLFFIIFFTEIFKL
jgi:hypothetical protein